MSSYEQFCVRVLEEEFTEVMGTECGAVEVEVGAVKAHL